MGRGKEKKGGEKQRRQQPCVFGEEAPFWVHLHSVWLAPDHNLKHFRNHSLTEKPFPKLLFFIIYTLESDKDFILHYTHLKLDSEHNKVSKHILKLVYKSNPNNSNKFC